MKLRTSAVLVLVASACWAGPWRPTFDEIDLGVDVRLNAVALAFDYESFIAVGSGGTIVRDDGAVWQLGNAELRDVDFEPDYQAGTSTVFVVGDSGTIAVGMQSDPGADIEWVIQESGTTANLHAIMVTAEARPIAVGDEVVVIGQPNAEFDSFEWIVQPAPPGGWGRLRDVELASDQRTHEKRIRAVGLDGRMWLVDTNFDTWQSIDAGTDEDLFDIHGWEICGAGGTIVTCGDGYDAGIDECTSERVGEVDFLGCAENSRLGSDRTIYVDYRNGRSYALDFQPRAIDETGRVVVGDDGRAGWWFSDSLHEL